MDANYRFIFIDIGEYRSNTDGNVFKFSTFGKKYRARQLATPPPKTLPGMQNEGPVPHVPIADEAFPLRNDLL